MRKKLNLSILILIAFLNQSCDPFYSVSIKNNSGAEIMVDAKLTNKFYTELTTTTPDKNNYLQFKVKSKEEFLCGNTIGGLKNDLPFSELIIYTKTDTIVAKNRNEVLGLFDKKWTGSLKTPYILTVE